MRLGVRAGAVFGGAGRAADVGRAIAAAAPNGIAVTVVQWSGAGMQVQVVPWRRVHDAASAAPVAAGGHRSGVVINVLAH